MPAARLRKASFAAMALGVTLVSFAGAETVPATGDALNAFLAAGKYKDWPRESTRHASAGPHPSAVIAYLNPTLEASLRSGAAEHPVGAAAVKELYDAAGELNGWAVSVKVASGKAGAGWYWYEVFGTRPDARPVADGEGVPLCFGCHTPGRDFVLTPFPLR
jgi:hypothetical protein